MFEDHAPAVRATFQSQSGFEPVQWVAIAALWLCVVANGAADAVAAGIALAVFGALWGVGIWRSEPQDAVCRRLMAATGVSVAVIIAAAVLRSLQGIPAEIVDRNWHALHELLGSNGGVQEVERHASLWNLPANILPFVGGAVTMALFRDDVSIRRLWWAIAWLGGAFALYGLSTAGAANWSAAGQAAISRFPGVTSFYVYRNAAATLLFLTMMVTADLLPRPSHIGVHFSKWPTSRGVTHRTKPVLWGLFGLQAAAMILTMSRAGVLLSLVGLAAYSLASVARVQRDGRTSPKVLYAIAAVVLTIFATLGDRVVYRLTSHAVDQRWCMYPSFAASARDTLPLGAGSGAVTAAAAHRPSECAPSGLWEEAHSTWLQGLMSMGLLYPVLVVVWIPMIAQGLFDASRRRDRSIGRTRVAVVVLSVAAAHATIDFTYEIPANGTLLAIIVASALSGGSGPAGRQREGTRPQGENVDEGSVSPQAPT